MTRVTLKIEGMHCDGCAKRIRAVLSRHAGVEDAAVSFAAGHARIRYNPQIVTGVALAGVIERAGFSVIGG